jgi:hypothetical protein
MVAKHAKVKKKQGKWQTEGEKFVALTLVLTALTTMCICNVRAECVAVLLLRM